ncbi:MAG TPA: hypothetical protein VK826_03080, partial [Bacteroidia bacterium]|nr:hypothetical protein [Bacteroidia bacterium]
MTRTGFSTRLTYLLFITALSIQGVHAQITPCGPLQASAIVDCAAGTAQLSVVNGYSTYTWSPAAGLSNDTIPNPVASAAGTYSVTATYQGPNLIVNPDFAAGNSGFTSGMTFSTIYTPCNYWVGAQWFQNYFPGLTDHTPTNDNMFMMIDGCTSPTIIWEESNLVVQANADYQFFFWATESGANQPTFEIHFIGNVTGDNIIATPVGIPAPNNNSWIWDQYGVASWNAGANTSVSIRIVNLATQGYGVDFGMDDFDFHQFCTTTDSVQVSFPAPVSLGADLTLCDVTTATLDAGPGGTYLWNTGATTQTIQPSVPGFYWVTYDNGICVSTDTVLVSGLITEPVALGEDIVLCELDYIQLDAGTGTNYLWNTGDTTQTITPTMAGTYYVTVGSGNCTSTDTIELVGTLGESILFIPNTITPNGNGMNDVFYGYSADVAQFHMLIFDR